MAGRKRSLSSGLLMSNAAPLFRQGRAEAGYCCEITQCRKFFLSSGESER